MVFDDAEIVSEYTAREAVQDGILVDITVLNPAWEKGLFNYATVNLLDKGYLDGEQANLANIQDLLFQAYLIVKVKSNNFIKHDWFFSGDIELPDGRKQQIFIQQNETGRFTLMLPEDY